MSATLQEQLLHSCKHGLEWVDAVGYMHDNIAQQNSIDRLDLHMLCGP